MKQKNRSLKQIGFFLLYTFSITWLSWLIIIAVAKVVRTLVLVHTPSHPEGS